MSVKVFILQVAVLNNYEHLVKILLDRGADPNIQNQVRIFYNQHQTAERSNGDFFLRQCFYSRYFSWKKILVFICSLLTDSFLSGKNNRQEKDRIWCLSFLKSEISTISHQILPKTKWSALWALLYTLIVRYVNNYFICVCFYFS